MKRVYTYRLNRKTVGYIETFNGEVYFAYYGKKSDNPYLVYKGELEEATKKIDEYFNYKLGLFKLAEITIGH